jgi:hypothetical protein
VEILVPGSHDIWGAEALALETGSADLWGTGAAAFPNSAEPVPKLQSTGNPWQ